MASVTLSKPNPPPAPYRFLYSPFTIFVSTTPVYRRPADILQLLFTHRSFDRIFFFYKKNIPKRFMLLLFYVICSLCSDTILLSVTNNTIIFIILSLFTIIEYSVFAIVLFSLLEDRIIKGVIQIASLEFYIFSIIYFFTSVTFSFDSMPASLEAILIISFSIFYLFEQMNKPVVTFVYQQAGFWFITGFIIVFVGNTFPVYPGQQA